LPISGKNPTQFLSHSLRGDFLKKFSGTVTEKVLNFTILKITLNRQRPQERTGLKTYQDLGKNIRFSFPGVNLSLRLKRPYLGTHRMSWKPFENKHMSVLPFMLFSRRPETYRGNFRNSAAALRQLATTRFTQHNSGKSAHHPPPPFVLAEH
jgi:hypothetical protein